MTRECMMDDPDYIRVLNAETPMDRTSGDRPNGQHTTELHPCRYLQSSSNPVDFDKTALIILNSPIQDLGLLEALYGHAGYRICCDGGANRLYDLLSQQKTPETLRTLLPNAIHGDLDSLRDDVRRYYEEHDVKVMRDPDQNSNDFGKCMAYIADGLPSVQTVLVLGSLGGRVDQGIGLLHGIYREQKHQRPHLRLLFFSEGSVSMVIMSGTTTIHTPLGEGVIEENVGILPLYGKAVISTEGLEWDVRDWPTEMGGNVSTSNHIKADQVSIISDVDVLFTIERRTT
ncbi:Thiamin pyrophosphokinase [Lecanosticta acicola]|uniref:Thiamine pyrophosphokinase n=1 Tax=Lecanosticta acicola TaxID=111012 RepID=A0AAI8Z555_9PEZI|nr:Thiamin pyrophosphokinase [Lecanosticta acicola]